MKLKTLLIIVLATWIFASIIEGVLTGNYIGYFLRNAIEGFIFLLGVYVGIKLERKSEKKT